MSERTRLGLGILGAASLLGLSGDLLLRATPWGLNWPLWAAAAAIAAFVVARFLGFEAPRGWPWLLGAAVLFSGALAWRASPALAAFDLCAAASCAALASGVLRAGVYSYARAAGLFTVTVVGGPVSAGTDVEWDHLPRTGHAGAAARGFAIALPLLAVFGGLFFAADAVFADFVTRAVQVDDAVVHAAVILLWAWVGAGLLHHVLVEREPREPTTERRLGAVEVGVALGLLNVLFLAFVVVQLRYLFGGDDHVVETAGLTYAQYARHGFFELVVVAALVVPVLLIGDALARPRRLFHGLSVLLVALLFVVMASAVQRLRLYTDAYGLTELRFYVAAFIAWLAVVSLWLVVTIVRERRVWFMPGAFLAGLAGVLALNVVNPDAIIARTNLDRDRLDVWYLVDLSADATPTIVSRLDELDPRTRAYIAPKLRGKERGWRSWNWSRARAEDALEDYARTAAAAAR